ncbi:unnamed protein product, partial [Iphiclides podalirius]
MYIDNNKYKKIDAEDKKQIKATGGGKYTPKLAEVGAQMLALMGDQIIPLSNACDSAAEYYEQNEAEIAGPQPEQDAIDVTIPIHDSENERCAFVAELSAKKKLKKNQ